MALSIQKTLAPGNLGTKHWQEKYGDALIAVRYRIDRERRRKVTTVEIAVREKPWDPVTSPIPPNKIVYVKVAYGEIDLGKKLRRIGGKWDTRKKLWQVPYKFVKKFDLVHRIKDI